MNVLRTRIALALQTLIEDQNGIVFQRLAHQCLHPRYPSLLATAVKADRGEDGITLIGEGSDGVIRSLACSLTAELNKIVEDAKKIKRHRSDVEELIFATPRSVTQKTVSAWKARIQDDFGWQLIVVEREEFLNVLERPDMWWVCREHLNLTSWGDCLKIPERHWDANLDSPGTMLRPDFAIVPFQGREREIDDLTRWATSDVPLGIRLYAGWGGFGKTRLAMEICKRLRQQGVWAGFLKREDVDTFLDDFSESSSHEDSPVLIVLDYVESDRDVLISLLKKWGSINTGRVRFMLLARGIGEWWEELKREGDGVG